MKSATTAAPLPIDADVNIPAAVRASVARAEEIANQIYGQNDNATDDAPNELQAQSFSDQQQQVETQTETQTPTAPTEDDQSWEHRYKSMKGRFDRSQDQIKNMAEQITGLQNILSQMQAKPAEDASAAKVERLVTEDEERDYGSDFLNVVGKRAKEELLPIVKGYESKIAELEAKLAGVGGHIAQDARTRMLSTLDERLPDWRDINYNDDFKSWLQLPDTYSGVIRHELLKAAYERNDTPRVAAFFSGFLAEEAAMDPVNSGPDNETRVVPRVPLSELAAPGRAKTAAATNAPTEKPFFARAQITQFYADSAAGKYKGREADRERIEKQIFDATREGRIR